MSRVRLVVMSRFCTMSVPLWWRIATRLTRSHRRRRYGYHTVAVGSGLNYVLSRRGRGTRGRIIGIRRLALQQRFNLTADRFAVVGIAAQGKIGALVIDNPQPAALGRQLSNQPARAVAK